jgi:hypothetical protein
MTHSQQALTRKNRQERGPCCPIQRQRCTNGAPLGNFRGLTPTGDPADGFVFLSVRKQEGIEPAYWFD